MGQTPCDENKWTPKWRVSLKLASPPPTPHYMLGISHNWGITEMVITFYCSFFCHQTFLNVPSKAGEFEVQITFTAFDNISSDHQSLQDISADCPLPPIICARKNCWKYLNKMRYVIVKKSNYEVWNWTNSMTVFLPSIHTLDINILTGSLFKQFFPRKKPLASTH